MDKKERREYMRKYQQSDAYKKYQQKYRQSDAYKKYEQKYQQSDAYKKYQQKYQQSDAYKKYQQKYRQKYQQSDAYKKYQQKYRQSDAFKNRNMIKDLKEHYLHSLEATEKEIRKYGGNPPIALEGKAIMEKEIISNLDIIKKYTDNLDESIRQRTIETMINQLLHKEGMLVSRRKLIASPPQPKGRGALAEMS